MGGRGIVFRARGHYTVGMRYLVGLLIAVGTTWFASGARAGDELDFQVTLLDMPPVVADSIEKRLVQGGASAAAVVLKLPMLIDKGTVMEKESLSFSTQDGANGDVGESTIDEGGQPVQNAVGLEYDVLIDRDGTIDFLFTYARNQSSLGGGINMRRASATTAILPGMMIVVDRFDKRGRAQLLLAKAIPEGGVIEAGNLPAQVAVRVELYRLKSARAAAAAVADPHPERGFAKVRAGGEMIVGFTKYMTMGYRGHSEDENFDPKTKVRRGAVLHVECAVSGEGDIDVAASLDYTWSNRARDKTFGEIERDTRYGVVNLKQCGTKPEKSDQEYVMALRVLPVGGDAAILMKAIEKVVAAQPPEDAEPGARYIATYDVAPSTLKVLGERFKLKRPTARQALEAGGIVFEGDANAIYKPQKSQIILRLDKAGHEAAAKLINSVLE